MREKLTGEAPPECARAAVDLWRPWIEERAGKDLAKLDASLRDQKAFAKLTRTILKDLELGEDIAEDSESEGSDEQGEPEPQSDQGDESADSSSESEMADAEMSEADNEEGDDTAAETQVEETSEPSDSQETDEGMKPWRPEQPFSHADEWGYNIFTHAVRRDGLGDRSLRSGRADAAAKFPRPAACRRCRASWRGWPTSCSGS